MTYAQPGMLPKHVRPSVTHDRFDLFSAIPLVAMDRASGTSRLVRAETTSVQPKVDVAHQGMALGAQIAVVLVAAIDVDHGRDGLPFPGESAVGEAGRRGVGCRRLYHVIHRVGRGVELAL